MTLKQKLINAGAILQGHFEFDGRHTAAWLDMDKVVSNPELFEKVVREIQVICGMECSKLSNYVSDSFIGVACDSIIGTPGIGSLIAAPIALRTGKQLMYVEKGVTLKTHKFQLRGEVSAPIAPMIEYKTQLPTAFTKDISGKKVLLITDVIETGQELMSTMEQVEWNGGKIVEVRCVWNKGFKLLTDSWKKIPILSLLDPAESWTLKECLLCKIGEVCPKCSGNGLYPDDNNKATECEVCGSSGRVNVPLTNPKRRRQ